MDFSTYLKVLVKTLKYSLYHFKKYNFLPGHWYIIEDITYQIW